MHLDLEKSVSKFEEGMKLSKKCNEILEKEKKRISVLIEKDGKLAKVQVKATGCKTKNNIYQLSLKSCGGTKGKEYKTLINTNIDYLFILNADLKMYVIPKNEIKNKSTINLGEKMNKFIVEF